jgi:hypothetical protein
MHHPPQHSGAVWEILCINSKSFYAAHILINPILPNDNLGEFWNHILIENEYLIANVKNGQKT